MKKRYLILLITIIIVITLYLYYEDNILKITHYEIKDNNLPSEFDNFKVAHISDYHNTKSSLIKNKIIASLKEEKPDIIVITGDLIDRNRTNINVALELIKNIKDISPIYYVMGNHESVIKEYNVLKEEMLNYGVTILENDYILFKKNNDTIKIIGIKDPVLSKKMGLNNSEIINNELKPFTNDNSYKILLSHRSEQLDVYSQNNINVAFTGHSHGGQIRLPFIGGVYAPNQGFFPKYTKGVHKKNNTYLVISRGIGNSKFPFRINNRPELVITSLKH